MSHDTIIYAFPWVPELGVQFSFLWDGLSKFFVGLILCMAVLTLMYSIAYLRGDSKLPRFIAVFMKFTFAMLGIVTANNLILLFIFWELTSITSFFLIGHEYEKAEARASALRALILTSLGGLCLLAGFLLLGTMAGTLEISELLLKSDVIKQHPHYAWCLVLILLGAFTKSAQFPFHFWLSGAMAAPAPVSAYLHSATMVKAGVFLLLRLHPALGSTELWTFIVAPVGAITMAIGAFNAYRARDMKLLFAHTTTAALGQMVFLIGLSQEKYLGAALTFLLVHALYKAALFYVTGIVDHEAKTRELSVMSGLRSSLPFTWMGACLATLSMAGIPPTLGFLGKETQYSALDSASKFFPIITILLLLVNATTAAVAWRAGLRPFIGIPNRTNQDVHEASPFMWFPPLFLGIIGISFGLAPEYISQNWLAPAITALTGKPSTLHFSLWEGWNVGIALSGFTFLLAYFLIRQRESALRFGQSVYIFPRFTGVEFYDWVMKKFLDFGKWLTAQVQCGDLRVYIFSTLSFFVFIVGWPLLHASIFPTSAETVQLSFYDLPVILIAFVGTALLLRSKERVTALVALGLVGVTLSVLFVFLGAPDLALTLVMTEALGVVLFALIVPHIMKLPGQKTPLDRTQELILCTLAGLVYFSMLSAAHHSSLPRVLTEYFSQASLLRANGRNVVNVVLVDFRGYDTLGEITVLSIGGLGVFALLRSTSRKRRKSA